MINKLLKWNPEFAKNVWLEISITKLIAFPAIVLLLAVFSDNADTISTGALIGFFIFGIIYGSYVAGDSMMKEYANNTWDWQKMSGLGAWKLAIGKLFGSTVFIWYGTLILWLTFLFSAPFAHNEWAKKIWLIATLMPLGLILSHSLSLMLSVYVFTAKKVTGFLAPLLLLWLLSSFLSGAVLGSDEHFSWFGVPTTFSGLLLLNIVYLSTWAVAGLYRSMRKELLFFDLPTWWLAFIATSFVYILGHLTSLASFFTIIVATCAVMSCFLLSGMAVLIFMETKDLGHYQSLFFYFREKRFADFFKIVPLWSINYVLAFGFAIITLLLLPFIELLSIRPDLRIDPNDIFIYIIFTIGVFVYILRDLGMLLYFSFNSKKKRANGVFIIYLVLMYFVFPSLTGLPGLFRPHMDIFGTFNGTIPSDPQFSVIMDLICALLGLGIVGFLFKSNWGKWFKKY